MIPGHEGCGCQGGPSPRPSLWRLARARAAWVGGSFYRRHLYRHVMRLAHRFNWHRTRTIGPLSPGNDYQIVCDWCGLRQTVPSENSMMLDIRCAISPRPNPERG